MVRIGSFERVHADLQKYEAGYLTSKLRSVEELDNFYKAKVKLRFVGQTADCARF